MRPSTPPRTKQPFRQSLRREERKKPQKELAAGMRQIASGNETFEDVFRSEGDRARGVGRRYAAGQRATPERVLPRAVPDRRASDTGRVSNPKFGRFRNIQSSLIRARRRPNGFAFSECATPVLVGTNSRRAVIAYVLPSCPSTSRRASITFAESSARGPLAICRRGASSSTTPSSLPPSSRLRSRPTPSPHSLSSPGNALSGRIGDLGRGSRRLNSSFRRGGDLGSVSTVAGPRRSTVSRARASSEADRALRKDGFATCAENTERDRRPSFGSKTKTTRFLAWRGK